MPAPKFIDIDGKRFVWRELVQRRREQVAAARVGQPHLLAGAPPGRLVTFHAYPVKKINKAWRGMRQAAELDAEVNPYSIRHTVARWVRQNGVPAWEVAAQLGHKSRDYRTTELYAAFDPAYLQNAVRAIDLLFDKLRASGRTLVQGCPPPSFWNRTGIWSGRRDSNPRPQPWQG